MLSSSQSFAYFPSLILIRTAFAKANSCSLCVVLLFHSHRCDTWPVRLTAMSIWGLQKHTERQICSQFFFVAFEWVNWAICSCNGDG